MNPARANDQDDLFTTDTAGLPEVRGTDLIRLDDGDRLDLRIGPVRKSLDGAELRTPAYNGSVPIFNFAIRGARAKLVGGDSGRYERETFTGEVLLAPSKRVARDRTAAR